MTSPGLLRFLEIDDGGFYRSWTCEPIIRQRTVVFGRNGCGKSTPVRHLAAANEPPPELTIEAQTDLDILAFNGDYVRENVGPVFTGTGLSSALFVTGSENREIEGELEMATQRRARVDRVLLRASQLLAARNKSKKTALDAARDHVRALPGERGAMNSASAEARLRQFDPFVDDDDDDEADAKDRRTLTDELASIPDSLDDFPDELVTVDIAGLAELLGRDVVADASEALANLTPDQKAWVVAGATLHEQRDTCLLCDTKLTPERSELLAALRTQELLTLGKDLKEMRAALEANSTEIDDLNEGITRKLKQVHTSTVDLAEVAREIEACRSYISTLVTRVAQKTSNPHERVQLLGVDRPQTQTFDQLRLIIDSQNEEWDRKRTDLEAEKQLASARCLGRLRATHLPQIDTAAARVVSARCWVTLLENEKGRLNEQIAGIEVRRLQTEDAEPLAAKLTHDLRLYLGHDELLVKAEVDAGATGFALYRSGGERASSLSEGECTAISLLHFIASLDESARASRLRNVVKPLERPHSPFLVREAVGVSSGPTVDRLIFSTDLSSPVASQRAVRFVGDPIEPAAPRE